MDEEKFNRLFLEVDTPYVPRITRERLDAFLDSPDSQPVDIDLETGELVRHAEPYEGDGYSPYW